MPVPVFSWAGGHKLTSPPFEVQRIFHAAMLGVMPQACSIPNAGLRDSSGRWVLSASTVRYRCFHLVIYRLFSPEEPPLQSDSCCLNGELLLHVCILRTKSSPLDVLVNGLFFKKPFRVLAFAPGFLRNSTFRVGLSPRRPALSLFSSLVVVI